MKCKKEIVSLIHKYLDEEITDVERNTLFSHIDSCDNCRNHLNELKKSIAYVQSSSHIEAPSNFTELVMKQLPDQKPSINWRRRLKSHPLLVAASLFLLLMSTSIFSLWTDTSNELSVTGQANLVIDKDRNIVFVPEGETVEGDLVVKNGSLQVDGQVKGNVTVINGQNYMAQAGNVTGDIQEIDKALEWFWYNAKSFFTEVIDIFGDKE